MTQLSRLERRRTSPALLPVPRHRFTTILIVVLLLVFLPPAHSDPSPVAPDFRTWEFVGEKRTWADAQQECHRRRRDGAAGQLAIAYREGHIVRMWDMSESAPVWLGLRQDDTGSRPVWTDVHGNRNHGLNDFFNAGSAVTRWGNLTWRAYAVQSDKVAAFASCDYHAFICEWPKKPKTTGWPMYDPFEVLDFRANRTMAETVCAARKVNGQPGHALTTYWASDAKAVADALAAASLDDAIMGLKVREYSLGVLDYYDPYANDTRRTDSAADECVTVSGPSFPVGYCGGSYTTSIEGVARFDTSADGRWKTEPTDWEGVVVCRYDSDAFHRHVGWKRFEIMSRARTTIDEAELTCNSTYRNYNGTLLRGRLAKLENQFQAMTATGLAIRFALDLWAGARFNGTTGGSWLWPDGTPALPGPWGENEPTQGWPSEPVSCFLTKLGFLADVPPELKCSVMCEFEEPMRPRDLPFSYEFHGSNKTFDDALKACQARTVDGQPGELWLARSASEYKWVVEEAKRLQLGEVFWVNAGGTAQGTYICGDTGAGVLNATSNECLTQFCPSRDVSSASTMHALVVDLDATGWAMRVKSINLPYVCRFGRLSVSPSLTVVPPPPTPAPDMPNVRETASKRFKFLTIGKKIYGTAKQACADEDWNGQAGRLPNTYGAPETTALLDLLAAAGVDSDSVWLGGNDEKVKGRWVWPEPTADGGDILFTIVHNGDDDPNHYTPYGYTQWDHDQPNGYSISQRNLVLYGRGYHGGWEDKAASHTARVVCEWRKPAVALDETIADDDNAHGRETSYQLHEATMTWTEARRWCADSRVKTKRGDGWMRGGLLDEGDSARQASVAAALRGVIDSFWLDGLESDQPALDVATAAVQRGAADPMACRRPFVCFYTEVTATVTASSTATVLTTPSVSPTTSLTAVPTRTLTATRSLSRTATPSDTASWPTLSLSLSRRSMSHSISMSHSSSMSRATVSFTASSSVTSSPTASRQTPTMSSSRPTVTVSVATATGSASSSRATLTGTPSAGTRSPSMMTVTMTRTASGTVPPTFSATDSGKTPSHTASTTSSLWAQFSAAVFPTQIAAAELELRPAEVANGTAQHQGSSTGGGDDGVVLAVFLTDTAATDGTDDDDDPQRTLPATTSARAVIEPFVARDAAACLDAELGIAADPPFPALVRNATGGQGGVASADRRAVLGARQLWTRRADDTDVRTAAVELLHRAAANTAFANSSNLTTAAVRWPANVRRNRVLLLRLPRVLQPGTGLRMSNDTTLSFRLARACAQGGSPAEATLHVVVRRTLPPAQRREQTPVEHATDGATVGAALISPTSAVALQRVNLMADYCGTFEPGEELSWLDSPTGASIGDDEVRYQLGASVANPGIVLATVAVFGAVGALHLCIVKCLQRRREDSRSERASSGAATDEDADAVEYELFYADSLVTTRAVHLMVFALVLMVQPTVGAAVVTASYGVVAGQRAAAVLVLLLITAVCATLISVFLKLHFFATFVPDPDVKRPTGGNIFAWLKWSITPSGDWEHDDAAAAAPVQDNDAQGSANAGFFARVIVAHVPDFPSLFDPLFMDYRDGRQWFLGLELAASITLAVGAAIVKAAGCIAASWILLLACAGHFIASLTLWPFCIPAENAFGILMSFMQLVAAAAQVGSAHGSDGAGDFQNSLIETMSGLAIARSVYEIGKLFRRVALRKRVARKPTRSVRGGPTAQFGHLQYTQALLDAPELLDRAATPPEPPVAEEAEEELLPEVEAAYEPPVQEAILDDDVEPVLSDVGTEAAATRPTAHQEERVVDTSYLDEMLDGFGAQAADPTGGQSPKPALDDEARALAERISAEEARRLALDEKRFEEERRQRLARVTSMTGGSAVLARRPAPSAEPVSAFETARAAARQRPRNDSLARRDADLLEMELDGLLDDLPTNESGEFDDGLLPPPPPPHQQTAAPSTGAARSIDLSLTDLL